MTIIERNSMFIGRDCRRALAAAGVILLLVLSLSRPAAAVGLVYIDADDGSVSANPNLFASSGGLLSDALDSTQSIRDNKWGLRTFASNGNAFEAGVPGNPGDEDAPELRFNLDAADGLMSGSSYDVYVAYWAANTGNWTIKGGLTSGNHSIFNRTGPIAFLPAAIAGTRADTAIWTTPPPLKTEADRTMYLGKIGTAQATGGQIDVFIDDLPTNAFPESTGGSAATFRSWLDGVAFVDANSPITLTATVDRTNGQIRFSNTTGQSVPVISYSINSAAGALDPNAWLSISDNYDGDDGNEFDTDVWNVTAPTLPFPAAATALSEAEDGSGGGTGGALTPAGVDLGNAWIRTPIQDLQISVTLADLSVVNIIPQYTGTAITPGDLDADNDIDFTDYGILSTNLHTDVAALTRAQTYRLGDMTGNLAINYDDFIAFRTAYNLVHGAGAFEAAFGVPEPVSGLLMAFGAILLTTIVRFRTRTGRNDDTFRQFNVVTVPSYPRSQPQMIRPAFRIPLAAIAALALAGQASAQLVTGWGYETGIVSGTLTEGVAGSFSSTGVTANAGPRALFGPLDFSDPGDIIQLTGTAQFPNGLGNQQFRAGLFNNNGRPLGTLTGTTWTGADPTGWLGYLFQLGGTGGTDRVIGRNGSGTGQWLANADTYGFGTNATTNAAPANTPYNFSLKLTRLGATSVRTDYTFVGGAINRSGSFTDNGGASSGTTSYNAVGFLMNNNTGSGQFSNVSVVVPKELRLRVNTTTGAVSIVNATDVGFDINYYEIRSASGALNLASWNSFDDQENGDPVGTGWEEAGGSTANILSETNLLDMKSVSPTNTFGIGNAFSIGGTQDLTFSYGLFNQSTLTAAFVEYVSGGVPGDYNENNVVDSADYIVWRENVGAATITNRGPGIAGNVGQADYDFWRSHFGAITASGSGSLAGSAAVPEPATAALAVLVAVTLLPAMRNRARTATLGHRNT